MMPNCMTRDFPASFETREVGETYAIEGYFAVYNSNYDMAPGMSESIAPGAFTSSLAGDIRHPVGFLSIDAAGDYPGSLRR